MEFQDHDHFLVMCSCSSSCKMEICGLVLLAWLLSPSIVFITGVVELSPSSVAPVCQAGDQLQLMCTSSGIVHRWEFTVFPENMTYPTSPVTSQGSSGVPTEPLTFSSSTITFSRLSGQNESPLVSRVRVNPVSSGLNGTVVKCFEGLSSTNSVATTTIRVIDAANFEQFMSDGVTISLEWALLNIQIYCQQLLRSITINAVPPIRNVMFTGNMRAQLVLSYNTLYNAPPTHLQHGLERNTLAWLSCPGCPSPTWRKLAPIDGEGNHSMLCLGVFTLLVYCSKQVKGLVEISPSPEAPVCQAGDQLELTCSLSGTFLRWQFTAVRESGVLETYTRTVPSGGTGMSDPFMINSTIGITFVRLSTQPLTSRMTISSVTEGLNGVQVNCIDVAISESAAATIRIIGAMQQTTALSIQLQPENFLSDRVVVLLERNLLNSNRYQQLLPNASANVSPLPEVEIVFIGSMSIQLTLAYNTLYNVSITQPGICGRPNQTAFIKLNYSKCDNPSGLIHIDVTVVGYEDPALEGENITFTCPVGAILTGPNTSTCARNGEWEPDPREVVCIQEHQLVTTGTTMPGAPSPSTATAASTQTLRTALISVACVLVIMSALTFLVGFTCGHCFSQRWKRSSGKKDDESPSNLTAEPREDLELKENVAYITIRPK